MLNISEKKMVRRMLYNLIYDNIIGLSTISSLAIVDIYLSFLWDSRKISLKQFNRYRLVFKRAAQNYNPNYFDIISFKGVKYD